MPSKRRLRRPVIGKTLPTSLSPADCLRLLTALIALAGSQPTAAGPCPATTTIAMVDGVDLSARLCRPDQEDRVPAIVTITPYNPIRFDEDARFFADHGMAFLTVSTRGLRGSGGRVEPFRPSDGKDGAEIVGWIARQDWSDGQVAMRGGSYGGYNQWSTVRHQPPALKSIVPIAAAYPGIDFPMNYNVPVPYAVRWAALIVPDAPRFGDAGHWNQVFRDYHLSGHSFAELPGRAGIDAAFVNEWMDHPLQDDWWGAAVPDRGEYAALALPMLTITGYYDGDQPGAMEYYQRHMRFGSPAGVDRHYLLLGPWNHAGTRRPAQSFGGITFGDAMMFDALALDLGWYRHVFFGDTRPAMLKERVNWFVAGANRWRSAPTLESVSDRNWLLYLAGADASSLERPGALSETVSPGRFQYVYDPLDMAKVELPPAPEYITDISELEVTDGNGLIFESAPVAAATEIAGYPTLELWLSMDVPDTDINATIYEIKEDGSSIALSGYTLRARHRTSLYEEEMVQAGQAQLYRFDRFYWFSRELAAGSRIKLFVRPANGLYHQRHYNAAGPVNDQTSKDARTATIRLSSSVERPSRLILPLTAQESL